MKSSKAFPIASVVIPVKNGEATIEACLRGILGQTLQGQLEVIIIDSGSTDGTCEILSRYPVQVHKIAPQEFNHGATRNLGVRLAKGDFVVMTVQDATPTNPDWLQNMLKHFANPRVAGVCGIQIVPHDADKNPIQWFRPVDKNPQAKQIHFDSSRSFTDLPLKQQHALCCWDDVNAMYRRSALIETPFRHVDFAEDALWAKDALMKGYTLIYDPNARVNHYHYETFTFRFKRTYTILYHIYINFKYLKSAQPLLMSLIRCIYLLSKEESITLPQKAHWVSYNAQIVLSSWLAHWTFRVCRIFGKRGLVFSHDYFCKKTPQAIKPPIQDSNI